MSPPFFPSLRPSERESIPAQFPVSRIPYMNNGVARRLLASKAGKPQLVLSYDNISSAEGRQFFDSWDACLGSAVSFVLPEEVYAGLGSDLKAYLTAYEWKWAKPPILRPTIRNVCSVEVVLRLGTEVEAPAPFIWISRLASPHAPAAYGLVETGPWGSIKPAADGSSFQVFFYLKSGEASPRIVLVKRDIRGVILWQRWTALGLYTDTTGSRSSTPQVLPLPDGGCVVAAKNWYPSGAPFYLWRFTASGSLMPGWSKGFSGSVLGPTALVLNGAHIVAVGLGTNNRPVLTRINLSTGNFVNSRTFTFSGEHPSQLPPNNPDPLIVLPNGNLVIFTNQSSGPNNNIKMFITEVTSDLTTIVRSKSISGGGTQSTYLWGRNTRLSDGSYLIIDDLSVPGSGALRLDSSLNLIGRIAARATKNTPNQGTGTKTFSIWGDYATNYALAADDNLGGYSVAAMPFGALAQGTPTRPSLLITKFSQNGTTVTKLSEIDLGAGVTGIALGRFKGSSYGINIAKRTGYVHLASSDIPTVSACRTAAVGFSLEQPEISNPDQNIPAITLNTTTCGNVVSSRGFSTLPITTITPLVTPVADAATTATSVTIVETTNTIGWSDPAADLLWHPTVEVSA